MRNPSHPLPPVFDRLTAPMAAPDWLTASTSRVRHILESVSDEFYVDPIQILSGGYTGEVLEARMACYWVMKNISKLSHVQIARAFGRNDRNTALSGIRKTEERRARDPLFREMTDAALAKSQVVAPRKLAA